MTTQHSSKFSRSTFVAVLAALALAATACGGGGDSADAPLPTDAPTTTVVSSADPESAPETTSPPETTTSTTALEPEPVPEPEPEVATQPEPEQADEATEGHDEVEGFEDVEPVEQDVICGDGLVLLAEFVTDTDNGCRPEMCDDGRTDHGDCQLPPEDEPMTEEEVAELPAETIPQEDYGLEGCTEVSLGVCDQDGLLFCHDTVEGWNECPGQPSEGCTKNDAAAFAYDHLDQPTGNELLSPSLSPGVWKLTARVCGNDTMTGNPSGFVVSVRGSATIAHIYQESVVDWFGEQSFTITEDTGAIEVWVTPEGNGQWVVAFYPIA